MEAVIGAVYIDGGTAAAYGLIERLVGDRLTSSASLLDHLDYKTALQELSARLFERAPVYVLREEGPDHAKHFFASVAVDGRKLGEGEGRSKKQAEQVAARMACEQLRAAAIDDNPVAAHG
jgi:ribonuclease-3